MILVSYSGAGRVTVVQESFLPNPGHGGSSCRAALLSWERGHVCQGTCCRATSYANGGGQWCGGCGSVLEGRFVWDNGIKRAGRGGGGGEGAIHYICLCVSYRDVGLPSLRVN